MLINIMSWSSVRAILRICLLPHCEIYSMEITKVKTGFLVIVLIVLLLLLLLLVMICVLMRRIENLKCIICIEMEKDEVDIGKEDKDIPYNA